MQIPTLPASDYRRADGTEPLILLTLPATAALCGLSVSTIKRAVYSHALVSVKVGRSRRVPVTALYRWAERLQAKQAAVPSCPKCYGRVATETQGPTFEEIFGE